jgi:rubrerythrin
MSKTTPEERAYMRALCADPVWSADRPLAHELSRLLDERDQLERERDEALAKADAIDEAEPAGGERGAGVCPRCEGYGYSWKEREPENLCPRCGGTGKEPEVK